MIRQTVALRYARALFQIDQKAEQYKKRVKDFEGILSLFKKHPKFFQILKAPLITQEEKEDVLRKVLDGHVDQVFLKFLCYLLKKKRIDALREIFAEYELLIDSDDRVWEADLVSVVPFQSLPKHALIEKLEKHFDKKIQFKERVDPRILGGMFLTLGNIQIDWRLKTRMQKLKTYLLGIDICR